MTFFKTFSHCCLLVITPLFLSASVESTIPPLKQTNKEFSDEESPDDAHKPSVQKHKYVVFKALNKVSARVSTIEVPLGEATTFQRLVIVPTKAYKAPPEDIPEIKVYVQIFEKTLDGQTNELFSGWMFASSPSSSAMEHPVYDVWITDLIEK